MILLLGFSFLAGFVTILAPCIWPVLPIVLSSSIAGGGGHKRPLGITLGVMLSFTIFTLSVSYLVRFFHLDPNSLRIVAVIVIGFLGLMMIIPSLAARFEVMVGRLANLFGQTTSKQGSGFLPGFITGLSLGIVWSPCAGPILATIAALAATGQVSIQVILITVAYVIGVGVPLFAFAYGGQRFIKQARGINKYTGRIQQVFGVVMILAAVAIYTNYDQTLQIQLLNKFPALGTVVNGFENSSLVTNQLATLKGKQANTTDTNGLFNTDTPAPHFVGITNWLNPAKPISIKDLRGKVVLVDFWTYSCINCIRSLPHVTAWYDTYHKDGLEVIGVHTPEFQFEHETNNVKNAIKMYNIHYPVAQDNNYTTWNAYNNEYWPAEYLIDAKGVIRREDFGEGNYDQMEMAIRTLLQQSGDTVTANMTNVANQTPTVAISPETYLGEDRMIYEVPDGKTNTGTQTFSSQSTIALNHFAFNGTWNVMNQYAVSGNNAGIMYHFSAGRVYLVMNPGSNEKGVVKVLLDGKIISQFLAGKDVSNGRVTVTSDRLYDLVNLHGKRESHTLQLQFETPGIQAYVFTFGS